MGKIRLRQYKISDLNRHASLLVKNNVYSSKAIAVKKEYPWIKKAILNYNKPNPDFYVLAIVVNNKFVGNIVVEKIYEKSGANIGVWIGKPYWGKGYATKAAKLFLKAVNKKFRIKTVRAEYKKGNIASGKLLMKNGFKQVKSNKKGVVSLVKRM